jgi:transcriptional regulator with XRE-family HTH domain
MTLKEWRLSKGWTQGKFAEELTKAVNREGKPAISDAHIRAWEGGTEPGWTIGDAISRLTKGKVKPASFVLKDQPKCKV